MKIIGKGASATVYSYNGNALKLYEDNRSESNVEYEFQLNKVIQIHFEKMPKALEKVNIDNKYGILFEKVEGELFQDVMIKTFLKVKVHAKAFAQLFHKINSVSLDEDSMTWDYVDSVQKSDQISDEVKKAILIRCENLEIGDKLCHGDFHPGNILVTENGFKVIDWPTAHIGNPCYDVARSLILLSDPMAKNEAPWYLRKVTSLYLHIFMKHFLKEYIKISNYTMKDIEKYILLAATLRLNDCVSESKTWLHHLIEDILYRSKTLRILRKAMYSNFKKTF